MNCPQCGEGFSARKGGRPQRYCSASCRIEAANARRADPVATNQAPDAVSAGGNQSNEPQAGKLTPNVEWLDVFPDLQRCVAGRLNKSPTTPREDAVGMDRAPIGHAVQIDGAWQGKVRRGGIVIWAGERFATLDDAKRAVETRLADSPDIVAAAMREAA